MKKDINHFLVIFDFYINFVGFFTPQDLVTL